MRNRMAQMPFWGITKRFYFDAGGAGVAGGAGGDGGKGVTFIFGKPIVFFLFSCNLFHCS